MVGHEKESDSRRYYVKLIQDMYGGTKTRVKTND